MATNDDIMLALWCDSSGHLLEVLQDPLKITANLSIGQATRQLCDPMSRRKFDQMIQDVNYKRSVYDWNLNILVNDHLERLHFVGGLTEDKVLLVATNKVNMNEPLYEEMININSDQANTLRAALKTISELKASQQELPRDSSENINLAEFTKLNNELVNLQRELTKRNKELAFLNEQKNQFLGMAAHDLRNPLGAISGFAELFLNGVIGKMTEEQLKFMQEIKNSSNYMLNLVTDLLDLSAIEAGKLELSLEAVDILKLAHQIIHLHQHHANTKQIELQLDVQSELPEQVTLDKNKMQQVISNLVSNAIKYSPTDTCIRIVLRTINQELIIEVIDQGQGIPEHELETLFHAFQKTSVKSTAGEKSTGLGLAIVQRIIEGHGGQISVTSRVGEGSTFAVKIPLHPHKQSTDT